MGGELQQAALPLNQTLERSHVVVSDENWNGTGAENFQKTKGQEGRQGGGRRMESSGAALVRLVGENSRDQTTTCKLQRE
ncbi:unnamed protein product [Sphagnum jensenii]|uniref:Uncharacterized protein n=1 Tax=Sphagnum jensenii TaxID=128206 RepID=A0ABP0VYZ7_9BRYO